jgi:hypothetical protein
MESTNGRNFVQRSFQRGNGENFCVDISYSGTAGGAKVAVSPVYDANNAVVNFPLPASGFNEWKNIHIEENLHPGNYQISVNVENGLFYIGGIHFCRTGKIASRKIKKLNYKIFLLTRHAVDFFEQRFPLPRHENKCFVIRSNSSFRHL